jgi:hypothetical protein
MKLLIFFSLLINNYHPVHVAFTNVDHNKEKQEMVIMSRIFYDDLDLAIFNKYQIQLNLGKENQNPESNKYLHKYYNDQVDIKINNKIISDKDIQLTKMEIDDLSILLYFKISVKKVQSFECKNNILSDLYSDQSNLMIIKISNKEESFRLTNNNNVVTLNE